MPRIKRKAKNQALFREVNERIADLASNLDLAAERQDDFELPPEYELVPAMRKDAAVLQRVTLGVRERQAALEPGGQMDTPL